MTILNQAGALNSAPVINAVTTATDLAGGTTNAIPYQTGVGVTGFLSQGTGVLQESAGAPGWTQSPALLAPTVTTQTITDSSTKAASTAFSQGMLQLSMSTVPLALGGAAGGNYNFNSQGSGCVVVGVASGGVVTSISSIAVAGTGYLVGDILILQDGASAQQNCYLQVTTVSGTTVTAVAILFGGTGYTSGSGLTTASGAVSSNGLPFTFTLTGTLTSNAVFQLSPGTYFSGSQQYIINNNTTGAYTTTFKLSNGAGGSIGTGVVIPQGTSNSKSSFIQTDGVNDVWFGSSYVNALNASTINTSTSLTVAGNAAMGGSGLNSGSILNIGGAGVLTGINQTGIVASPTGTSGGTSNLIAISTTPTTTATSYTCTNAVGLYVNSPILGAGSTITNAYGILVLDQTTGTNNFGIRSSVTSGAAKWNLWLNGTAANYLAAPLTIGSASMPQAAILNVTGSGLFTGTGSYGIYSTPVAPSTTTSSLVGVFSQPSTAAASFTCTSAVGFQAGTITAGAGSTITNAEAISIADQTAGASNFGIYNNVSSGTNKWAYYGAGTANNVFAGNVAIGSTTAPTIPLVVTGAASISGTVTLSGIQIETGGVTPSTWNVNLTSVIEGQGGSLYDYTTTQKVLTQNAYFTTGAVSQYKTTLGASEIQMNSGQISFNVAASGTAGSNITWITAQGISTTGITSIKAVSDAGGHVIWATTAVTIASGFGTSPSITSNNTAAFAVTIGSAPGSTGVITLPTASNGWVVTATNITSNSTLTVSQSAGSTTSVTLTSYSRTTGLATNFNASDVIVIQATAY